MLRNGELVEARWQTVVVGEIIKLENDQFVAVFPPFIYASLVSSFCFAVALSDTGRRGKNIGAKLWFWVGTNGGLGALLKLLGVLSSAFFALQWHCQAGGAEEKILGAKSWFWVGANEGLGMPRNRCHPPPPISLQVETSR